VHQVTQAAEPLRAVSQLVAGQVGGGAEGDSDSDVLAARTPAELAPTCLPGRSSPSSACASRPCPRPATAGLVNNLNDGRTWVCFPILYATAVRSLTQISALAALYPAVSGLGQLVTSAASDRWGCKPLFVAGMLTQAAAPRPGRPPRWRAGADRRVPALAPRVRRRRPTRRPARRPARRRLRRPRRHRGRGRLSAASGLLVAAPMYETQRSAFCCRCATERGGRLSRRR
jgi:hypothetical protein